MGSEDDLPEHLGMFDFGITCDPFGVPSNLMGQHDETFFSMLGRIVSLSASLEYRALSFYQALAGAGQDAFIEFSVSRVIKGARKELHRLADDDDRRMASAYLTWTRRRRSQGAATTTSTTSGPPSPVSGHSDGVGLSRKGPRERSS